jgi:hypothetical protein
MQRDDPYRHLSASRGFSGAHLRYAEVRKDQQHEVPKDAPEDRVQQPTRPCSQGINSCSASDNPETTTVAAINVSNSMTGANM